MCSYIDPSVNFASLVPFLKWQYKTLKMTLVLISVTKDCGRILLLKVRETGYLGYDCSWFSLVPEDKYRDNLAN
jgi:hypothetical protein